MINFKVKKIAIFLIFLIHINSCSEKEDKKLLGQIIGSVAGVYLGSKVGSGVAKNISTVVGGTVGLTLGAVLTGVNRILLIYNGPECDHIELSIISMQATLD